MDLKNKRGDVEGGLNLFVTVLIMFVIFASIYFFIIGGLLTGDMKAEIHAKNIGTVIDMVGSSPYTMRVVDECPEGDDFGVSGSSIEVNSSSLMGEGSYRYYFTVSEGMELNESVVDCSGYSYLVVEKSVSDDWSTASLGVYGEEE